MKKVIWVFLLLVLSFSLTIAQEQPAGSGTEADPYLMGTLDNLVWLVQTDSIWDDGAYFVQTANINAAATDTMVIGGWNPGWSPIGNANTAFIGTYDGGGFVVDSLFIHGNTNSVGFFGVVGDLTVKNLGLTAVDVAIGGQAGVLVGFVVAGSNLVLDNIYATGKVEANGAYGTGLVGFVKQSNYDIRNSYSDLDIQHISGSLCMAGGFIGYIENDDTLAHGIIEDCYALGDVTADGDAGRGSMVGGFIGRIYELSTTPSPIRRCYATGNVTNLSATNYAPTGGFAGDLDWCLQVEECYSTGDVTSTGNNVGGFAGYVKYDAGITNCYATGNVTRVEGENANYGGFIGRQRRDAGSSSVVTNCYFSGNISGLDVASNGFIGDLTAGDQVGCFFDSTKSGQDGTGSAALAKTTAEMQTESTFTDAGWDFTNTWEIVGTNYPTFKEVATAVENSKMDQVVSEYSLNQNYPNPFNPTTTISFALPVSGNVTLTVYNMLGQKVANLVNGELKAGTHQVQFDGANLSSGIYLYKLQSNNFVQVKKMMLIK